ncbi:MAG: transposase, partial [Actinomycetota bacterium]|nr:transposase [Actinomycetota bacterium]
DHPVAGARAKLTATAVIWATNALERYDSTVSAMAHQLGVAWRTAWAGIEVEATRRIGKADRLDGVEALGVDEHVWTHTGFPGSGMVTGIIDQTRDKDGNVHARLLDLVPGRSGKVYADWPKEQGGEFTKGIKVATLDPFRGYANAVRDELPEVIQVVDAFHIVKLGTAMVDDVRRRVQRETLGRRGRKADPLFGIKGTLQHGVESMTEKQVARFEKKLNEGYPKGEVTIAWQCYQKLRTVYHATPAKGRELVTEILQSFPSSPIPEEA